MSSISRRSFLHQFTATTIAAAVTSGVRPTARSVASAATAGDSLEVGVARRDPEPQLGQPMWGYIDPDQLSEGVRDPLYVRVVVLRVGDTAIGLAVLDMGRMPVPERCARLRERAKRFGIDDVIFSATHTHSGPYMELPDLPHLDQVEEAILEGLEEALNNAEPAKIGLGRGTIDIAHNRRLIKDGVCHMRWRNEERVATSPIDKEAAVIRLDSVASGKPLVSLVHYACHPVIFASDNKRYSADWPGEMCKLVREETGGECVFLQGCAGDINPYLDKTSLSDGADANVVGEGRTAGRAVLAILKDIETSAPASPAIAYREDPVVVGTRWDFSDPTQTRILEENYGIMYEKYMKGLPADFAVPAGVLLINGDLALGFTPGEMFIEFQLDFKRRSAIKNAFLCGYGNEFHLYFPTVRDISYGGYGGATVTYVGVGAGEKLVTQTTRLLGEMTGGIHALRGPEDFEILEL